MTEKELVEWVAARVFDFKFPRSWEAQIRNAYSKQYVRSVRAAARRTIRKVDEAHGRKRHER